MSNYKYQKPMKNAHMSAYLIGFQVLMLIFSICAVYTMKVFPNANHYVLMYIIGFLGIPMNIICFFYMRGLEETTSKYEHEAMTYEDFKSDYTLSNLEAQVRDYEEHKMALNWFETNDLNNKSSCDTCNDKKVVMFSCCTGKIVDYETGLCPKCFEHLGYEDCPDCCSK